MVLRIADARIQRIYSNAKQRCESPKDGRYAYYGGRGIQFHLTYDDLIFLWNRDQAGTMRQPSIHRKDGDGHYTKENCCFLEWDEHRRLRRPKPSPTLPLMPDPRPERLTCAKCGWTWLPRVWPVRKCPKCKHYDWQATEPKETPNALPSR